VRCGSIKIGPHTPSSAGLSTSADERKKVKKIINIGKETKKQELLKSGMNILVKSYYN
jgi:hypothetical protein